MKNLLFIEAKRKRRIINRCRCRYTYSGDVWMYLNEYTNRAHARADERSIVVSHITAQETCTHTACSELRIKDNKIQDSWLYQSIHIWSILSILYAMFVWIIMDFEFHFHFYFHALFWCRVFAWNYRIFIHNTHAHLVICAYSVHTVTVIKINQFHTHFMSK